MYQPNPKRMKDWLSIPKSNGYESLHITVLGPKQRWVEVQIRTRRMDEIAERGLAAHWKYKGIKSENGLDDWMNNVREVLEAAGNGGALELMRDFKMDLYDKEVFVFTPKGDLYKLPLGAKRRYDRSTYLSQPDPEARLAQHSRDIERAGKDKASPERTAE